MRKNDETKDVEKSTSRKKSYSKGKRNSNRKGKDYKKDADKERPEGAKGLIPMKDGDKNPNWYFTDRAMAEQVTQLAFQNLAGHPIEIDNVAYDVPNVVTIFMNPCPGVNKTADYNSALLGKSSGINLAGFRTFSELAAYTGRSAIYGPQDISTMILGLGEIISIMEMIRRAFGVAFTMNMRNRSYPRTVLECMYIDPDDLFANFSDYRTRFNTLVTMVNQIPIPASIAYFDKCRSIFQEIYLDAESDMAQSLITMPSTTWILDETSYSGGTILKSVPVCLESDMITCLSAVKPLSYFLNIADSLIGAMLNSSTLNVVYTDLLNLATKKGVTFLKLDYLSETYSVTPRYSREFLLQMHNATLCGAPVHPTLLTSPHVTPYNDVYPNPNNNCLFYNPGFFLFATGFPRTGKSVLADTFSDSPDLVDRIEMLRFASISGQNVFTSGGKSYACDATMPDHYIVGVHFWTPSKGLAIADYYASTLIEEAVWPRLASLLANIDWAPRFYEMHWDSGSGSYATGNYSGDVNFYTVVPEMWIRKVNQFVALALYTIR